ncbi:hypothetical protein [Enterococcus faecalis]|uniref:hypothetical protein n=1 Tax=Enterococcus faecalis TaxID=1351 RepID=UPI004041DD1B
MNLPIFLSITSTIISVFVLYRTFLQERFSLQVNVRNLIESPTHAKKYNRLYIALNFTNRSKLPLSIYSVKLSISGDFFGDNSPRIYSASFIPLEMYSSYSSDDPENKQKFYTDVLPINLNTLSSSSVILGFSMPDYFVRRAQYDNPKLIVETSRKTIEVPIKLKTESDSMDISKWLGAE